MSQLSLFERPELSFRKPPSVPVPTSEAAARKVNPDALRSKVLEFIRAKGEEGATDCEIQAALGLSGDTQRPRRWELHKAGLIKDSGKTRPTKFGREATVWVRS